MPFPALIAAAMGLACLACNQQAVAPESTPAGSAASIRVTDLTLGAAVGLDKKVREPSEVFAPDDTIYVSVVTEGRSSDTMLGARWRQGETVLQEIEQAIAPDGTATSEFHVSKPGGFAKGEYEVEILVEGRPVQKRRFTVK